jgi:hypothetical protein
MPFKERLLGVPPRSAPGRASGIQGHLAVHDLPAISREDEGDPGIDGLVAINHGGKVGDTSLPAVHVSLRQAGPCCLESTDVSGLKAGDLVLAPFVWADNTCDLCRQGLQTSCRHGGGWAATGIDGGQPEPEPDAAAKAESEGGPCPHHGCGPDRPNLPVMVR